MLLIEVALFQEMYLLPTKLGTKDITFIDFLESFIEVLIR
jgi:hypothetical protein